MSDSLHLLRLSTADSARNKQIQVLLIEDDPAEIELVRELLLLETGEWVHLSATTHLSQALQMVGKTDFDVILADLSLPDAYGLEVVARMHAAAPHLPIIVLSAASEVDIVVRAMQTGAQDYLVKGRLDGYELSRAVRYAIERKHSADQLRLLLDSLEARVEQRTAELRAANAQLRSEAAERERAELALRASEANYVHLADLASDAVLVSDNNGDNLQVNNYALEMFGYSREEFGGLNYRDLIDPDNLAAVPLKRRELLAGQTALVERLMRRKDGTLIPTEISSKMLPDGRIQSIVRDISQRHRIDEERRSRLAAEQANEAKSEFLSRMSHELRTPLNAILGFGQLLEMDDLAPQQRESVGYILQAGRHLLALVEDVLDITRLEKGRIAMHSELLEPAALVEEAVELLRPYSAERASHLKIAIEEIAGVHVLGDHRQLLKAMLNLLSNAIKYNRPGGVVIVGGECRVATEQTRTGRLAARPPRQRNLLRVLFTDSGPGIPPDKLNRLFTPFDRFGAVDHRVEGRGLGLLLAKLLVESMGGSIGVESEPGEGTTFWIELPVVET